LERSRLLTTFRFIAKSGSEGEAFTHGVATPTDPGSERTLYG
jgi:hypothetical protein